MAVNQVLEDQRSLGDLLTELARETGELVRQEVTLATAEVKRSATDAGRSIAMIGVGAAIGFLGLMSLTAAVIVLLQMLMPLWAAAILVAVIYAIAAYFLITPALATLRKTDPVPRDAIENVKEDVKWLKNEMT